jgi:hypothetical protein
MRIQQKDIRRTTVLTTMSPVIDAASGNGTWSDGTPWHMQRNLVSAAGEYTMFFDPRIFVLSGSIGPNASGRWYYKFEVVAAGQVRVQVLDSTELWNSANFDVTINILIRVLRI